jgi:hypothetical protein
MVKIKGEKKMDEKFLATDFTASGDLLAQLIDEVKAEEGTLSGGTKLGPGAEALRQLKETRVSFGNPYHNLTRLTSGKMSRFGIELPEIQKQHMKERYDFYYMTLSVSMQPGRSVQFSRLECHLDFLPKGKNEPIVHSIFPNSEWREVLRVGRNMELGLNSNLEWTVKVPDTAAEAAELLPAEIKGKVESKNKLNAYIAVPDYSYQLGVTEIAAMGEGNSECFWRIDKPELKQAQTVQFGTVFKVPKGARTMELTGLVSVEPDFQWLTGKVKDVFEFLSDKIKNVLRMKSSQRAGDARLPVGDGEKWTLELPQE